MIYANTITLDFDLNGISVQFVDKGINSDYARYWERHPHMGVRHTFTEDPHRLNLSISDTHSLFNTFILILDDLRKLEAEFSDFPVPVKVKMRFPYKHPEYISVGTPDKDDRTEFVVFVPNENHPEQADGPFGLKFMSVHDVEFMNTDKTKLTNVDDNPFTRHLKRLDDLMYITDPLIMDDPFTDDDMNRTSFGYDGCNG